MTKGFHGNQVGRREGGNRVLGSWYFISHALGTLVNPFVDGVSLCLRCTQVPSSKCPFLLKVGPVDVGVTADSKRIPMNSHTINRIIVFSPWNVFIYIILCNRVITLSYFRCKGEEAEVKGFAQVKWQSQGLYHPTLRTMAITLGHGICQNLLPWVFPAHCGRLGGWREWGFTCVLLGGCDGEWGTALCVSMKSSGAGTRD